jgi:hypothetical protein
VHLRTHTGANPYLCNAQNCHNSYISRQLLWKHQIRRHAELRTLATKSLEEKRTKRALGRFQAASIDSVRVAEAAVASLLDLIFPFNVEVKEEDKDEKDHKVEEEVEKEGNEEVKETKEEVVEEEDEVKMDPMNDPIAAAVASIMGPAGNFDVRMSPVKQPTIMSPSRQPPQAIPPTTPQAAIPVEDGEPPQMVVRSTPTIASSPGAPRPIPSGGGGGALIHRPGQGPLGMIRPKGGPLVLKPGQHPPEMKGIKRLQPVGPAKILPPNARIDSDTEEDEGSSSGTDEAAPPPEKSTSPPAVSSIWNQDLMFMADIPPAKKKEDSAVVKKLKTLGATENSESLVGLKTISPAAPAAVEVEAQNMRWELDLSESSGQSDGEGGSKPKKVRWSF